MTRRKTLLVEKLANKVGIELIDGVITDDESAKNAVGTDGFTYIIVGDDEDVYKYPEVTDGIYKTIHEQIQKGTYKKRTTFDKNIEKNIKKADKVPEIDVVMTGEVDGLHFVIFTDTLMAENLKLMREERENG